MSPEIDRLRSLESQTLVAESLVENGLHVPAYSAAWLLRLSRRGWIIEAVTRLQEVGVVGR